MRWQVIPIDMRPRHSSWTCREMNITAKRSWLHAPLTFHLASEEPVHLRISILQGKPCFGEDGLHNTTCIYMYTMLSVHTAHETPRRNVDSASNLVRKACSKSGMISTCHTSIAKQKHHASNSFCKPIVIPVLCDQCRQTPNIQYSGQRNLWLKREVTSDNATIIVQQPVFLK
jgi:hypothetical protein